MEKIIQFSIFKNKKSDNEKAPTHSISTKVGEDFINIGSCWTKQTKSGDSYLSCALSKSYVDHTNPSKSRKAYVIVAEEDINPIP